MIDRNNLLALREAHPDWTLEQIGRVLNITKARTWQLLKKHNKPTKRKRLIEITNCIKCLKITENNARFCSRECRDGHYYMLVGCIWCGTPIKMLRSTYKKKQRMGVKNFHCTQQCNKLHFWSLKQNFKPQVFNDEIQRQVILNQ